MKPLAKLTALALATVLSTGALAAYAASDTTPAYPTQQAMLQTADEALNALTRVHAARLALFNNDIEAAKGRQALDQANDLIQQGAPDDAVELLRLASVDVNVTVAMLPVVSTTGQLEAAATLIDDGKYFDANVALKAIEDSVILRRFSIDEIPQQGDDGSSSPPARL